MPNAPAATPARGGRPERGLLPTPDDPQTTEAIHEPAKALRSESTRGYSFHVTGRRHARIRWIEPALRVAGYSTLLLIFLVVRPASAALTYSAVDRATVRVIGLGSVDVEKVERGKSRSQRLLYAVPKAGHGSGVLLSSDGLVLTAKHVVEGMRHVAVRVPGSGEVFPGRVIYRSKVHDFAFVAIEGQHKDYIALPESSPALAVRQTVHAIGYPMDVLRDDPQSSRGIVAGVLKDATLQLDIAVNPGNSGGPLIDGQDQLIGIVIARGDVERGVVGMGFAVPLAQIRPGYQKVVSEQRHLRARTELQQQQQTARAEAAVVWALMKDGIEGLIGPILEEDAPASTGKKREKWLAERKKQHARYMRAREAFQKELDRALARGPSADIKVLGAAYLWNRVVSLSEHTDSGWRDMLNRALSLVDEARKDDPKVGTRSRFVTYITHKGGTL